MKGSLLVVAPWLWPIVLCPVVSTFETVLDADEPSPDVPDGELGLDDDEDDDDDDETNEPLGDDGTDDNEDEEHENDATDVGEEVGGQVPVPVPGPAAADRLCAVCGCCCCCCVCPIDMRVAGSWFAADEDVLSSDGITRLSPIPLTIGTPVADCTTIEEPSSRGSSWESSEQSSSCSRL
uniref:Putative secreted protein n=1 Tax=Anopheles triannulatus TaxID=58253 RepID=A0A2M4B5Y6_9DIPT